MVAIGSILVSDEIFTEQFVCDLEVCKGGCCEEGDAGAPLTDQEAKDMAKVYPVIEPLLSDPAKEEIRKQGFYETSEEFGKVTPTINGGLCVYGYRDQRGIIKCAIDDLFRKGATKIQKPISCHLYPIRVIEEDGYIALNYEPRPGLCDPACRLGCSLKMPVYQFLKKPLIRRFGEEFYEALEATAKAYFPTK